MIAEIRSNAELAAAVHKRAGEIRRGRARWRRIGLSAASVAVFSSVCLATVKGNQGIRPDAFPPARGSMAELAGGGSVGGYVLVGLVCFSLGIVLALLSIRAKDGLAGAKKGRG